MFISTRNGNHDKRDKRHGAKKGSMSSRLSILSGITTSSGDSSGSGSTITQDSLSRSRRLAKDEPTLKQSKRRSLPVKNPRRQSTGSMSADSSSRPIDVFAYLDRGQPSLPIAELDVGSASVARSRQPIASIVHEEFDLESTNRSLHSDSGISIRDSSPDSLYYRSYPRSMLDPLQEEEVPGAIRRPPFGSPILQSSFYQRRPEDSLADPRPGFTQDQYWNDRTENFYFGPMNPDSPPTGISPGFPQAPGPATDGPSSGPSGYDLLAARIGEAGDKNERLRPAYRRFERLNHRILLQFQDEISYMEECLANLDAEDSSLRKGPDGTLFPESQRLNWQWHGSELHMRRQDLLGQIAMKLEQYNRLLTSFQKVTDNTVPAKPADVCLYRTWMNKNNPIADAERRFLDHSEDLIAFRAARVRSPQAGLFLLLLVFLILYISLAAASWSNLPLLLLAGVILFACRDDLTGFAEKMNGALDGCIFGGASPVDASQDSG